MEPDIQQKGYPEEKLTEGGDGLLCKVYYEYLALESGYVRCWKDEFRDPDSGIKRTIGLSAIPVIANIAGPISFPYWPFPFRNIYSEFGLGVSVVTEKLFISGRETRDTGVTFALTFEAGINVPIIYKRRPAIGLDLAWKWYRFYGAATMSNLAVGIGLGF